MLTRLFHTAVILCLICRADAATLEGVVVDTSRQPVPGATVALVKDQPTYTSEEDMKPFAETKTNSEGEFRLNAPDTGAWALIAHGPGLRRAKFPVNVQAAAERRIGLRLEPGAAVTGRVTGPEGNPVSDAVLGPLSTTIETRPEVAGRVLPQWVRTDNDGRFAFAPTQPDVALTFAVQAPGFETAMIRAEPGETDLSFQLRPGGHRLQGSVYSTDRPRQAFANATVRASSDAVSVVSQANENSEFTFEGLPPGEYSLSALFSEPRTARSPKVELPRDEGTSIGIQVTSGYYVRGRTMDAETSTPAPGVAVRIRDAVTTSGADGYFSAGPFYEPFQVVPEVLDTSGYTLANPEAPQELPMSDGFQDLADLEVQVRKRRVIHVTLHNLEITTMPVTLNLLSPSRRPVRSLITSSSAELPVYHSGNYLVYATSGHFASEATAVNVGSTSTNLGLTLGPSARLQGNVLMAGDSLSTRPMTFTIRLFTTDPGSSAILVSEAHPTARGFYRFPILPAGNFIAQAVNESATRRETRPVTLRPGETLPLDFIIEPGNLFAGVVQDGDANPVPAVQITFYYPSGGFGDITADDQGRFRAEDLLTSDVLNVQVEHYGFAPYRRDRVALPAEDFVITLQRQSIVRARVEAPTTSRWRIQLMDIRPWGTGGYADQLMSNPVGQAPVSGGEAAEFPIPHESQRLRLVATEDNGQIAVSPPFSPEEARKSEREFVLVPGQDGSIFGSVGAAGIATEVTAWNTALPEDRVQSEYKVQTNNGNFQINGLPPGDYLVLALGEGVNASAENVELGPNENKRVDLQTQAAAAIQGRVLLAGEGVSRAQVELLSESNPSFSQRTATTNAQGEFIFHDVLPDSYLVSVLHRTSEGELKGQRSVKVTRGTAPPPVLLDLTPVRPVLLEVPPEMSINPGAAISLVNTQTREVIAARWVEGGLEAPLPPGEYEVWNGDAVAGKAEVSANGTGRLMPANP